jgi:hypothetical protein
MSSDYPPNGPSGPPQQPPQQPPWQPPGGPPPRRRAWTVRHPAWTSVIATAGAIIVIGVIVGIVAGNKPKSNTPSAASAPASSPTTVATTPALAAADQKFVSDAKSQFGFSGNTDAQIDGYGQTVCSDRKSGMSQSATLHDISTQVTSSQGTTGLMPLLRLAETDLCPQYIPPVTTHIIATFTGSGDTSTPQFTISPNDSGNWVMAYTYDCSGQVTGNGNFIVNEDNGSDSTSSAVSINNLDKGQTGAWNVYSDAGAHYLAIQTQCPYTIKVEQRY